MDTKLKVRRLAHAHGWLGGWVDRFGWRCQPWIVDLFTLQEKGLSQEKVQEYTLVRQMGLWFTGRLSEFGRQADIHRIKIISESSVEGVSGGSDKLGIWRCCHPFFLRNQADAYSQQEITEIFRTFCFWAYIIWTLPDHNISTSRPQMKYNLINPLTGAIHKSESSLAWTTANHFNATTECCQLKHTHIHTPSVSHETSSNN